MEVLLVDDDDIALDALEHALTQTGHQAVIAHDGREAYEPVYAREVARRMIFEESGKHFDAEIVEEFPAERRGIPKGPRPFL